MCNTTKLTGGGYEFKTEIAQKSLLGGFLLGFCCIITSDVRVGNGIIPITKQTGNY